jgi:hypothetical protein
LALFEGKEDRKPVQKALPWPKLADILSHHDERSEKDGALFSPTLYRKGATRSKSGVQSITAFVLDFDTGVAPEMIAPAWSRWEHLIYSTFSHTPGQPKWRVVFPLAEEVPAEQWPQIYRNLAHALGFGHPDPSCKDCSRIYYLPSCPPGAERFARRNEGVWLEPFSFPAVAEEKAETTGGPIVTVNPHDLTETLLARALDRASAEGRNNAGLWLACQLRDNCFDRGAAEAVLADYQARVPDTGSPYTWEEALHSLDQAFASAPREPWEQAIPFPLEREPEQEPGNVVTALAVVSAAVAQLKQDPGAVMEPETLDALNRLRRWDPANWARIRAELKKHSVSLKDLERALEQRRPQEAAEEPEKRQRRAGDMLDECPAPNLIIPSPYVLQEQATARLAEGENGSELVPVTLAPLLIVGRARETLTGQELLLLAWRWPGRPWAFHIVDRASAIVGRKLADLSSVGFPYLDSNARDITSYLARLEAANHATLPCARVTAHLGWQGDPDDAPFLLGTTLIQPDGTIETAARLDADRPEAWGERQVMFHGTTEGEQQIVSAFHSAGTFEKWAQTIALLQEYPRVMTAFYAGFVAPLLEILKVPNFIIDLSHSTTTGKSTSARTAASIWVDPDERRPSSGFYTWDMTRVFIERLSATASHVPTFLDDTKRAKSPQFVAEVLYMVAQGRGRGRGTIHGIARTGHWRTVLISTGEQSVTSFTNDGGTRTRTLAIKGLPLKKQDRETDALAKLVNQQLCANYGHAGQRFIQALMQNREHWNDIRALHEQWSEYYTAQVDVPESGRLSQYAAAVTVAGALAHQYLDLPWDYTNPMAEIWSDVAHEAQDAAGEERALREVISWAYAHERTFHGRSNADIFGNEKMPPSNSGRWDGEDWQWIGFHRFILDRVLTELHYQPEAILTGWRTRGWLHCDAGGFTTRVRVGKGLPYMVKIWRSAVEAVYGGETGEQGVTE